MDHLAPELIAWCALSLALAGVVKGIAGIGIPLVGLSLLSLVITVPQAVALLPIPVILANTWQALATGYFLRTCKRFAWLLISMTVGTAIGAGMLTSVDQRMLMIGLGGVILGFALLELTRARIVVPMRHQGPVGAVCGLVGGVLGGMSAIFGPPIIMFLVSTGMHKDEFVGTITSIYLISGVVLGAALASHGIAGQSELAWSALAAAPLLLGMLLGQWSRKYFSELVFRKLLLIMLVLAGLNMMRKGVMM